MSFKTIKQEHAFHRQLALALAAHTHTCMHILQMYLEPPKCQR